MQKDNIKKTVYYLTVIIGWGILAWMASQYVMAFLMDWILGEKFGEPFWVMIYYILSYSATLSLLILGLPRLVNWYEQHRQKKSGSEQRTAYLGQTNDFSTNLDEMGLKEWPSFIDIGLVPIGYIIYILVSNFVSNLLSNFSWFDADQAQDVGFGSFIADNNRIWAVLAIVFIAPIAEEIFMRGWFYGKVRSKVSALAAILIVSIVFGMMHGQWNAGVATFVLSLVLCGMREITGTIWSGMLLHMLSNGIAFYLLYIVNFGVL